MSMESCRKNWYNNGEKNYSMEAETLDVNVAISRQVIWNSCHKCIINFFKKWKNEEMMEKLKSFEIKRQECADTLVGVKDTTAEIKNYLHWLAVAECSRQNAQ